MKGPQHVSYSCNKFLFSHVWIVDQRHLAKGHTHTRTSLSFQVSGSVCGRACACGDIQTADEVRLWNARSDNHAFIRAVDQLAATIIWSHRVNDYKQLTGDVTFRTVGHDIRCLPVNNVSRLGKYSLCHEKS